MKKNLLVILSLFSLLTSCGILNVSRQNNSRTTHSSSNQNNTSSYNSYDDEDWYDEDEDEDWYDDDSYSSEEYDEDEDNYSSSNSISARFSESERSYSSSEELSSFDSTSSSTKPKYTIKTINYHLNGGLFLDTDYELKSYGDMFTDYYNNGYWQYHDKSAFLYDKNTIIQEDVPIYAVKLGLAKTTNENLFFVDEIVERGKSFNSSAKSRYWFICHDSNEAGYNTIQNVRVGDYLLFSKTIPTAATQSYGMYASILKSDDVYPVNFINTITLNEPFRYSHEFAGWYKTADLTGSPMTTCDESCDVYAKWEYVEPVVEQGDPYTTRTNSILAFGADISVWQGSINWSTFKSKSDFVIIKIGGSDDGTYTDSRFKTNMDNAISHNMPAGVYFFSSGTTKQAIINEANYVIDVIEKNNYQGKMLKYPIYLDYETASVVRSHSNAENTEIINAWADTIISRGYYPGLYMGGSLLKNNTNVSGIKCDIWVAAYWSNENPRTSSYCLSEFFNKYYTSPKITMWQYDSQGYTYDWVSGSTLGFSSKGADNDICFVDYPSIITSRHFNGF